MILIINECEKNYGSARPFQFQLQTYIVASCHRRVTTFLLRCSAGICRRCHPHKLLQNVFFIYIIVGQLPSKVPFNGTEKKLPSFFTSRSVAFDVLGIAPVCLYNTHISQRVHSISSIIIFYYTLTLLLLHLNNIFINFA